MSNRRENAPRSRWAGRPSRAVGGLVLCALISISFAPGCNEDEPRRILPYPLLIEVRDSSDGSPQSDVKLLLMDVVRNVPVQDPVLTDSAGTAHLTIATEGHFAILAYPGGGRGVYHLPGSFHVPPRGPEPATGPVPAGVGGPLAPRTSPLLPIFVRIQTIFARAYEDRLPRVRGQIVDALSGEPLSRVFVGVDSFIEAYNGDYSVRDDVTGRDGLFHVADVPFSMDAESGEIFQDRPLVIVREGYLPRVWYHAFRPGDDEIDISGVVITLEPIAAQAMGSLTGRVTFLGDAMPGIRVGLSLIGPPAAGALAGAAVRGRNIPGDSPSPASGIGLPGLVRTTASDGTFQFTQVPPGWYIAQPAYLADDDFTLLAAEADLALQVEAEETTGPAQLPVIRTIYPLSPPAGGVVQTVRPTFRWTAVAEADSYGVYLGSAFQGAVAGREWTPPADFTLANGSHSWQVIAIRSDGTWVGMMEGFRVFRVDAPAEDVR